jgi:hypothetical protein
VNPPSAALPPVPSGGIIPVGQEPPRQPTVGDGSVRASAAGAPAGNRRGASRRAADKNKRIRADIRNPDGFYKYKNRLDEFRVFRAETMRTLRRAELAVWLAIFGCQHHGSAQIGQRKICEITGIKKRDHVSKAVKSLRQKGLLEVVLQGRYRPNGAEEHGLSSVYRVYPRAEPRLLKKADEEAAGDDKNSCPGLVVGEPKGGVTKNRKPR